MHVCLSVYYFQSGTAEESLAKAQATAYPIYRQRPGFVAYEPLPHGRRFGHRRHDLGDQGAG